MIRPDDWDAMCARVTGSATGPQATAAATVPWLPATQSQRASVLVPPDTEAGLGQRVASRATG
eukprot:3512081-Rhodomonas_salina.1